MDHYAIVDENNSVVTVSLWDGVTPWQPNPGLIAVKVPDGALAEAGGTYDPKTKTFVPAEPLPARPPSDLDVLAKVLIDKGVITQEEVAVATIEAGIGDVAGPVDTPVAIANQ